MSQIVHRINEKIISDVVNRHHLRFLYYYDLKAAVAALINGEPEYDFPCVSIPALSSLSLYNGIYRVSPKTFNDGRVTQPPKRFPLLMRWGYVVDGKVLTPKSFVAVYEASQDELTDEYLAVRRKARCGEGTQFGLITDYLGITSVIRITFNMNYEG